MFYLSWQFWVVMAASGFAGTLLAIGIARLLGAKQPQPLEPRRFALGLALFVPAPLLLADPAFGPFAGFLYLAVAATVIGRQGLGPAVASGEGEHAPVTWGALLTRGAAFATGALATFYAIIEIITRA